MAIAVTSERVNDSGGFTNALVSPASTAERASAASCKAADQATTVQSVNERRTGILACPCDLPSVRLWTIHASTPRRIIEAMKIKVVVHEAEEGGFWAEVPAIPGCATQGETFEELLHNLYEAIEGCLSVDVSPVQITGDDRVLEIAI